MEFENACDSICGDIAGLLLQFPRPTPHVAYAAARATRDVADALHHAAGTPADPRWHDAIRSVDEFTALCRTQPRVARLPALAQLRRFVDENADLAESATRLRAG
ncbi:MAG TPA: hypothetical protein VMF61_08350 [Candidatus Acidoferrales bacterium]|nr:hypothetical protein [Candidatus Acidoferrales bacterium]